MEKKNEIERRERMAVHKALKLLSFILENEEGINISKQVIKRVKTNWRNK